MLAIKGLNLLRRQPHPRDLSFEAEGRVHDDLGRNGVGKTTLLKCPLGRADPLGASPSTARTSRPCRLTSARGWAWLRAAGREIFPAADCCGKPADGSRAESAARNSHTHIRDVSSLKDMLHRRGGDLSGGQQTAARDRPRASRRSENPDSRRADRGHPAIESRTSAM